MTKLHYSELGLVNTSAMFAQAMKEKYAVPAYNFNNMEQLQAIVIGCSRSASPVILQVSGSARSYIGNSFLPHMAKAAVGFPIVLHGASSVTREHVDLINRYGGKMENTAGIPADQLRRAAASAVCKVNIDSDGRLAMTAIIRKIFAEKPGEFDPRKYLGPARDELVEMVIHKNTSVLGSAGRIK